MNEAENSDSTTPDPLGRLAEEVRLRLDRGEPVDAAGLAATFEVSREDAEACIAGLRALAGALEDRSVDLFFPPSEPSGGPAALPRAPDDYEIEGELGRGGMGIVYRARQRSLDRPVALKVLRPGDMQFGDTIRRFRQEAQALARLRHPHIVAIHQVGDIDGNVWYTMDLIDGRSLAHAIGPKGMTTARAVRILREVASAVAFTHGQGLIHRDLKPANVLLDATDRAFVSDFGLARELGGDASLTQTGQLLGTPAYMSPEQAAGDSSRVGELADIHALGVILYECLTGKSPFRRDGTVATLEAVLHEDAPPLRRVNPKCPEDLEIICAKAMAKRPSDRYATAQAFEADLERFEAGRPIIARPPSILYRLARLAGRQRAPIGASLFVTGALVALYLGFLRPGREENAVTLLRSAEALHEGGEIRGALGVAQQASDSSDESATSIAAVDLANRSRIELAREALDGADAPRALDLMQRALAEGRRVESRRSGASAQAWPEAPILAGIAIAAAVSGRDAEATAAIEEFLRSGNQRVGDDRETPARRLLRFWQATLRTESHPARATARTLVLRVADRASGELPELTALIDGWEKEWKALDGATREILRRPAEFRIARLESTFGRWRWEPNGLHFTLSAGMGEGGVRLGIRLPRATEVGFRAHVPGFEVPLSPPARASSVTLRLARLPAAGRVAHQIVETTYEDVAVLREGRDPGIVVDPASRATDRSRRPVLAGTVDAPFVAETHHQCPESGQATLILLRAVDGAGSGADLDVEGWRTLLTSNLGELARELGLPSAMPGADSLLWSSVRTQLDIARVLPLPEAIGSLRRLQELVGSPATEDAARVLLARAMAGDASTLEEPALRQAPRLLLPERPGSAASGSGWWWLHLACATGTTAFRDRALDELRSATLSPELAEAIDGAVAWRRFPAQPWLASLHAGRGEGRSASRRAVSEDPVPVVGAMVVWLLGAVGLVGSLRRSPPTRLRAAGCMVVAGLLAVALHVEVGREDLLPDDAGYAVAAVGAYAAARGVTARSRARFVPAAAFAAAALASLLARLDVFVPPWSALAVIAPAFIAIAALPSLAGLLREGDGPPSLDPWSALLMKPLFLVFLLYCGIPALGGEYGDAGFGAMLWFSVIAALAHARIRARAQKSAPEDRPRFGPWRRRLAAAPANRGLRLRFPFWFVWAWGVFGSFLLTERVIRMLTGAPPMAMIELLAIRGLLSATAIYALWLFLRATWTGPVLVGQDSSRPQRRAS